VSDALVRSQQPLLATPRRRIAALLAATAFAGLLVGVYGGGTSGAIAAAAGYALVVLAAIDLEQRRVPNRIVLPAAAIVLAAHVALDPSRAWVWLVAAFGGAFGFFVLAAVYPAGLGMGDVKLVILIGAALGPAIVPGLLLGMVSAAVFGIGLIARHGRSAGRRTIAYAPFLVFGALVALMFLRP
jgi:leader peptidase (prepilin peptidase)/N-methyltransferase